MQSLCNRLPALPGSVECSNAAATLVPAHNLLQHNHQFCLSHGCDRGAAAGKWIAAQIVGRTFAYTLAVRKTLWSLTLPQVAETLAAALVAFKTFDPAGQRLIDAGLLNVVLVLMLTTAILGPVLTACFALRMRVEAGIS